MEQTPELKALHLEEIENARRLSIERKLELGGELFDSACEVSLSGIRWQNPGISADEAFRLLRERLSLGRRLEKIVLE